MCTELRRHRPDPLGGRRLPVRGRLAPRGMLLPAGRTGVHAIAVEVEERDAALAEEPLHERHRPGGLVAPPVREVDHGVGAGLLTESLDPLQPAVERAVPIRLTIVWSDTPQATSDRSYRGHPSVQTACGWSPHGRAKGHMLWTVQFHRLARKVPFRVRRHVRASEPGGTGPAAQTPAAQTLDRPVSCETLCVAANVAPHAPAALEWHPRPRPTRRSFRAPVRRKETPRVVSGEPRSGRRHSSPNARRLSCRAG